MIIKMSKLSNQHQDFHFTNGIDMEWPRVKYSLRHPSRRLYSELLDYVSSKKSHELESFIFQTVRAGMIEGKSQEDLRAEISPLIKGYRLSESETYVNLQIRRVIGWLKQGFTPPQSASRTRPSQARARSAAPKAPASIPASLESREKSNRIRLMKEINRRHQLQNPRRLKLIFDYDQLAGFGRYSVECLLTGKRFTGEIEAANLRHFQLLLLEQVFTRIAPRGCVELLCDDVEFVMHFAVENLLEYRWLGWKASNGDRLPLVPLYERLDRALNGRDISIMLPDEIPDVTEGKNTQ